MLLPKITMEKGWISDCGFAVTPSEIPPQLRTSTTFTLLWEWRNWIFIKQRVSGSSQALHSWGFEFPLIFGRICWLPWSGSRGAVTCRRSPQSKQSNTHSISLGRGVLLWLYYTSPPSLLLLVTHLIREELTARSQEYKPRPQGRDQRFNPAGDTHTSDMIQMHTGTMEWAATKSFPPVSHPVRWSSLKKI